MCIGVPGKILAIHDGLMPMADLDFGGTARECCLAYVPEARVGDYVLIQNGFAMDVIDEASAKASLEAISELGLGNPGAGLAPDAASGD